MSELTSTGHDTIRVILQKPDGAAENPFCVNQQVIEDEFPQIGEMNEIFEILMDAGWVSDKAAAVNVSSGLEPDFTLPRKIGRKHAPKLEGSTSVLTDMGVRFVVAHDDPKEGEANLRRLLKFPLTGPAIHAYEDLHASNILETATIVRRLQSVSERALQPIRPKIDYQPQASYAMLKVFADPSHAGVTTEAEYIPSKYVLAMDILTGSSIASAVRGQLEQGLFDQFIVDDIMDFYEGQTLAPLEARGILELARYSEALASAGTFEQKLQVKQKMLGLIALWPQEAQSNVELARKLLLKNLDTSAYVVRDNLGPLATFPLVGKENPADLVPGITESIRQVASDLANMMPPQRQSKAAIMRARANKRRGITRQPDFTDTPPLVSAQPEAEQKVAKLVAFNAVDDRIDESPEALEAKIAGYMSGFNRQDKQLADDVTRILEYLQRIDWSNGNIRGIKKITDAPIKVNGQSDTIWEFKPLEAVGLSTATQLAKGIRVLFVRLSEGSVGIVEIADRRDVPRHLANIKRAASNNN